MFAMENYPNKVKKFDPEVDLLIQYAKTEAKVDSKWQANPLTKQFTSKNFIKTNINNYKQRPSKIEDSDRHHYETDFKSAEFVASPITSQLRLSCKSPEKYNPDAMMKFSKTTNNFNTKKGSVFSNTSIGENFD